MLALMSMTMLVMALIMRVGGNLRFRSSARAGIQMVGIGLLIGWMIPKSFHHGAEA